MTISRGAAGVEASVGLEVGAADGGAGAGVDGADSGADGALVSRGLSLAI